MTIAERWNHSLYDPYWRCYRNRHDGAEIFDDERTWPLRAGVCYLVPAWCRVRSRCRGEVGHDYLHFEPVGLPRPLVQAHFNAVIEIDAEPLRDLWSAIPIREETSYLTHMRWQSALCLALVSVLTVAGADNHESPSETGLLKRLAPALRLIDAHLAAPIAVPELAAACDLGREHFGRLFARALGVTPARYVQERRITVAAERLLRTEDPIETVAEDVGFSNRYHFTRVFRTILRTTPGRYRQQGRV